MAWKFYYWVVTLFVVLLPGVFIDIKIEGFLGGLLFIIGFLLLIYSLSLASIAGRTLKLFGHKDLQNKTFWPDKFIEIGIYKCMRHPMHLGLALLPLSIALIWGNVASIIASGWGVAAALFFVLNFEEPQTIRRFSNYCKYLERVKPFNLSFNCLKEGLDEIKRAKNALTQENSKVEVKGFEARYYDKLMDLITFGWYKNFIKKAIEDLNLKKGDFVADFGAGTGRNAVLMTKYIKKDGLVAGFEIGKEMSQQFEKKAKIFKNLKLIKKSILEPINLKEYFDMVFISFVLHGFTQENREKIIKNAYNTLKKGGKFAILDYNEFDVNSAPFYVKFAIKKLECPLAQDFINKDLKKILQKEGFCQFEQKEYFKGYLRLLIAKKGELNESVNSN